MMKVLEHKLLINHTWAWTLKVKLQLLTTQWCSSRYKLMDYLRQIVGSWPRRKELICKDEFSTSILESWIAKSRNHSLGSSCRCSLAHLDSWSHCLGAYKELGFTCWIHQTLLCWRGLSLQWLLLRFFHITQWDNSTTSWYKNLENTWLT